MTLSAERKKELIETHRRNDQDVGSAQVQVAILTERIRDITEHLKRNKKDFASQRGLLKLVGRRNTLLRYLARRNLAEYQGLIASLGLRK